jgi:signal transduction histidine kinase
MHVEKLQDAVSELERQLHGSKTLDAESRQSLQQAVQDIRTALDAQQQTETQRQSLLDRLRLAVEKFEGSHPTLTGTLMRLIDGLGEMGI